MALQLQKRKAQHKPPTWSQAAPRHSHRATTDERYKLSEPETQRYESYHRRVNAERPAILSKEGTQQVVHDLEELEMKLFEEAKEQRLLLRADTPVELQYGKIRQDGTLQTSETMKPRKRKRTAAE